MISELRGHKPVSGLRREAQTQDQDSVEGLMPESIRRKRADARIRTVQEDSRQNRTVLKDSTHQNLNFLGGFTPESGLSKSMSQYRDTVSLFLYSAIVSLYRSSCRFSLSLDPAIGKPCRLDSSTNIFSRNKSFSFIQCSMRWFESLNI